jgi:segregation and condensation protein B
MEEKNLVNTTRPLIDPSVFEKIESEERENSWKEDTGLDLETLCGAVETIIFMSDKPVSIQKIKKLIHEEIPLKLLYESISTLQKDYENKRHGIRLVEVAEGFQFRTKPVYSRFVQDLFKVNGLQLTQATLEVLAVVAYRQPVTKFDVEKIRGVDSSHLIRTLIDKRLVKISGRSEDLGRPTLYSTTPEFLDVFNLTNLSSLPPEYELEEIVESSKVSIKDFSNIRSGDQERFIFDEVSEIDKLASQIREIQTSTKFTDDLKGQKKVEDINAVKSPFELLESYIAKAKLEDQMREAKDSHLVNSGGMAVVISDLLSAVHNAPEDEGEEEDFEMIDLDTGLPIGALPEKDLSVTEGNNPSNSLALLAEEKELEAALDAAFESFKDGPQESKTKEELTESSSCLDLQKEEKQLMESLDENNFNDLFPPNLDE